MIAQRRYALFVVALLCVGAAYAKKYQRSNNVEKGCQNEDSCLMDPNCKCYCSEIGGYRKKTADDNPIYVKGDPRGKYCYCKQWDWDNFPGPTERPESEQSKRKRPASEKQRRSAPKKQRYAGTPC